MGLLLGLISAVGPFAIDMYLPALPQIGAQIGASDGAVQLSLTVFFVAMGLGQLAYGPLSDRWGRRLPLLWGLGLFVAASAVCALAPRIEVLLVARFVQGLGAAAGVVIPRAIVRDLHTGADAARLMALLMLVFSVSPVLAPLAGSALIDLAGWRAVFWAVGLAGASGMALVIWALPESHAPAARTPGGLAQVGPVYGRLLRDGQFIGLTMIGGLALCGFFIYLARSSFVLMGHYGLSGVQYSLAFAANAVAFVGTAQLTGRLVSRFGLVRVIRASAWGSGLSMGLLLTYFLLGHERLPVLIGLMALSSCFMGLVIPTSSVLALEAHGPVAGAASALLGTLQSLAGALGMAVISLVPSSQPLPMVIGVCAGMLACLALTQFILHPRRVAGQFTPEVIYGSGRASVAGTS